MKYKGDSRRLQAMADDLATLARVVAAAELLKLMKSSWKQQLFLRPHITNVNGAPFGVDQRSKYQNWTCGNSGGEELRFPF